MQDDDARGSRREQKEERRASPATGALLSRTPTHAHMRARAARKAPRLFKSAACCVCICLRAHVRVLCVHMRPLHGATPPFASLRTAAPSMRRRRPPPNAEPPHKRPLPPSFVCAATFFCRQRIIVVLEPPQHTHTASVAVSTCLYVAPATRARKQTRGTISIVCAHSFSSAYISPTLSSFERNKKTATNQAHTQRTLAIIICD